MVPESEDKAEVIEAVIGELSSFHDTFGYYAQGVDHTTSKLPEGWENRLIEICNSNTKGISGLCLEFMILSYQNYMRHGKRILNSLMRQYFSDSYQKIFCQSD